MSISQGLRRRLLHALLQRHQGSLAEFGAALARAVRRDYPYSKAYIIRLRDGKDPIPDRIALGLLKLAQQQPATEHLIQPQYRTVVLSLYPLRDKTIVLAPERCCANPDCNLRFVPDHPARRYCSLACRRHAAWLRRHGAVA